MSDDRARNQNPPHILTRLQELGLAAASVPHGSEGNAPESVHPTITVMQKTENGMTTSHTSSTPLEIDLIRPPGREPVYLTPSSNHPGMLIVIGLGGLPHGALIGLDPENRRRLRQWLDAQEPVS